MQKTRLGITVGLMGALTYFIALFGGYMAMIIVAGYILLFETNEWLKKSAVKAAVITIGFAVLIAIINLIPDAVTFVSSVIAVFGKYFSLSVLDNIINVITTALAIIEKVLLLLLGIKALRQGSIGIAFVDRFIQKHTDNNIQDF